MNFRQVLSKFFKLSDDESESCIEEVGGEMSGGTGFLSFRRKLKIKKGQDTIHVFLKFSDKSRQELGVLKDFSDHFCPRECLFYSAMAPLLERSAVQMGMGSTSLPTVYVEMVQPAGTLIVMEDLGEAGYQMAPAMMNVKEARCVLGSLARIQAAYWLTRARLGNSADGLFGLESPLSDALKTLENTDINFDVFLVYGLEVFRRDLVKHLKCERRAGIINAYLDADFLGKARKIIKSNRDSPEVAGITHSDLWYNNVMISRDSSGHPVDCRIIDWQFFGIGCIAYDLGPLWISSINNAIVTKEFLPCVDFYYDAVQSAYENATGEKFPFSVELMRQKAVQYLNFGIAWVIMSADTLGDLQCVENVMYNIADLIEHFKL